MLGVRVQIKTILGLLCGSVVVHAVTIACRTSSLNANAGDAAAESPAPAPTATAEISEELCNKTYEQPVPSLPGMSETTSTVTFAEHAYPGKSKFDIAAHVTTWSTIDDPKMSLRPESFRGGIDLQSAVYARDGFAGAGCRAGGKVYFVYRP